MESFEITAIQEGNREIMSVPVSDEAMVFKRIYTSGCGKGVIFHNPMDLIQRQRLENDMQVNSTDILALMKSFQRQSEEHQSTRGVHSGALAVPGEILIFRDDIGRHNAIDKVIGESLYQGIGFSEKILLTSGRISSEILSKALRCRMPLIVAVGAPTNQAVKLAREVHLTLVGLVKGNRMIVYSGEDRSVAAINPGKTSADSLALVLRTSGGAGDSLLISGGDAFCLIAINEDG